MPERPPVEQMTSDEQVEELLALIEAEKRQSRPDTKQMRAWVRAIAALEEGDSLQERCDRVPRDRQCVDECVSEMTSLPAPSAVPPDTFSERVSDIVFDLTQDLCLADRIAAQVDDLAQEYLATSGEGSRDLPELLVAARLENAPLARTVAGRAYLRILKGNSAPSLNTDAAILGVSKQALHKAEILTRTALLS